MWVWPALLLGVPLFGAIVIAIAPSRQAKWIALGVSAATFVYSVMLALVDCAFRYLK